MVRKDPYLEEDIAIINIALDQLGQTNFLHLAANLFNDSSELLMILRLYKTCFVWKKNTSMLNW